MTTNRISAAIHELRTWVGVRRLMNAWRSEIGRARSQPGRQGCKHLLIIPCDPWTLTGSKGDEAMIAAVVQQMREASTDMKVTVVVAAKKAEHAARRLGFNVAPVWQEPWDLGRIVQKLWDLQPDAVAVLGADVMDGYYSPLTSLRLLAVGDLLTRRGARGTVLGFSFNDRPYRSLSKAFDRLSEGLAVNVRDARSFDRFRGFSRAAAVLVADAAFMLKADMQSTHVAAVSEWVWKKRNAGHRIIVFNAHPMLIRNATPQQLDALIRSAQSGVSHLIERHDAAIVLLSHDYRGADGDDICLEPIFLALQKQFGDRLFYPREKMSASELKAIAGLADGVVTGRMHLAIASLGMGVPVAAMTYQDKFNGLFEHFGLPSSMLMNPEQAMRSEHLTHTLDRFMADLPALRGIVETALPAVRDASRRNLRALIPGVV